jgi:hypothetical protein
VLTRYKCGHVGKQAGSKKIKRFIRVAEIRNRPVSEEPYKQCPSCKGNEESAA